MSRSDLQAALRFQLMHRNLRIGDICVLLGFVPRRIRDTAIDKQAAAGLGATAMLQLAREQTLRLASSIACLEDVICRVEGVLDESQG